MPASTMPMFSSANRRAFSASEFVCCAAAYRAIWFQRPTVVIVPGMSVQNVTACV